MDHDGIDFSDGFFGVVFGLRFKVQATTGLVLDYQW
jgi:hypothetical protein